MGRFVVEESLLPQDGSLKIQRRVNDEGSENAMEEEKSKSASLGKAKGRAQRSWDQIQQGVENIADILIENV